jgi:hypothetical protein
MPKISIILENNTSQDEVIDLFQSKDKASQAGTRFTSQNTPYKATYPADYYFRIKADNINYELTLTSTYTRQQVIDWMNTLNIGTWTINPSTAYNIFVCFSAFNTIEELEIAESNKGIGRMIIESTFIID